MPERYLTGETAHLTVGPILDPHTGVAYDPVPVVFLAWAPGTDAASEAATLTYTYLTDVEVERDALGTFHVDLPLTDAGRWEYRFTWGTGDEQGAAGGVFVVDPNVRYAWAPTVDRIAAILRTRTRGKASRDASISGPQGTFTATTWPTAAQVIECIDQACGDMSALMGGRSPCTNDLALSAGSAAAYRAAMIVEVSYYSEQTNGDQTAFSALESLWNSSSTAIAAAVVDQCPLPAGSPGAGSRDDGMPMGRVPDGPLIGRRTAW